MNTERPALQTNYSISFLLNKYPQSFIPYAYFPSLTDHRLNAYEVNTFLQKVEKKYSSRSTTLKTGCSFGLGSVFFVLFANAYYDEILSTRWMGAFCLQVVLPVSILAGCYVFAKLRENQNEIQGIIDEENEGIIEKGLRWYLPKNSETIELCTDYKFFANKAINDEEENIQNTSKKPEKFMNKPAINEDEDFDVNSQNHLAVATAVGLYGLFNLVNFTAQFGRGKTTTSRAMQD